MYRQCFYTLLLATVHSWLGTKKKQKPAHTVRRGCPTFSQHCNTALNLTPSETWKQRARHLKAKDTPTSWRNAANTKAADHVSPLSCLVSVCTACKPDVTGQSVTLSFSFYLCAFIKPKARRPYCCNIGLSLQNIRVFTPYLWSASTFSSTRELKCPFQHLMAVRVYTFMWNKLQF